MIKGLLIDVKRGQSLRSLDSWASRWGWNKTAVRRFLNLLQNESMIVSENVTKTTRITVCKYDTYQGGRNAEETVTKRRRNSNETVTTPNNNDNNVNNENKYSLLVARKQKFALTLEPFSNKYPREMLVDFYNYWTEPNKSQTKFRQELEITWDVARRLDTWARRERSKVIPTGQPKKSKFETNVETFSQLIMPE